MKKLKWMVLWLLALPLVTNTKASNYKKKKKVYEYFLLVLVVCFLLAIALDYLGIIRMQRYL